jgi:hypothetical protein
MPAESLAARHPMEGMDGRVALEPVRHVYTVDGVEVPRSASAVVSAAIGNPFNAKLVISSNLASWKANRRSKYHAVVHGLDDEAAAAAVEAVWTKANVLGTKLHARAEEMLNDRETPEDGETDVEWRALEAALNQLKAKGWIPRRSELSLWYEALDGRVVCAGQMDALFDDNEGNIVVVDFKRTAHDLSPTAVPFGGVRCTGKGLQHLYANDHTRYSLQTSIYAVMLEQRTGTAIDPSKRFLLQAHPEMGPCAIWTQCADLDTHARALLNAL